MNDPVPAITESSATGEIAAIFTDIRQVLGVDVVNLIWRHLATLPGALPWAWRTLRPLYVDGTITTEAVALHGDLELPRLPAFPAETLTAAGLLNGDVNSIRKILAAYDRTNAMALIALSALLSRLEHVPPSSDVTTSPNLPASHARNAPIHLPALLNMADLPPSTTKLVMTLNRLGSRQDSPILASMYRHLAYWPSYLALAWTMIAPLDDDGRLARAITGAVERAQARAERVATQLRYPVIEPLEVASSTAIREAIEPFVGDVIARMAVICAVLRAATDERSASSEPG